MDVLYWASLVVGGVAVLDSIFGGADGDADTDMDLDGELDAVLGAGGGWVDLLSLHTVTLFAAFFGLCGVLLPLAGVGGLMRALVSIVTGLGIGVTGNWVIKRVGYAHVSSAVTPDDLHGRTVRVIIPFDSPSRKRPCRRSRIRIRTCANRSRPDTRTAHASAGGCR